MSLRWLACVVLLAQVSMSPALAAGGLVENSTTDESAAEEAIASVDEATETDNEQATGDDSDQQGAEVWTETIVVTANRTERRTKDIPLHATILTVEEIAIAPESGISDVVRQIPSLNLHGDQSSLVAIHRDQSLNFRGVSGSNVSHGLLLVDGMPLLDPYNASAAWTKVAKDWVERVEVVAGGGANTWGNLALSGVVNLITQAPTDSRFATSVRGGSKSTQDVSLSYSDLAGPWSGWIGVDYFDTDGFQIVPEESRGLIDEPLWKQYQSLTGRGSYTISANSLVHFGGLAYSEERGEGTPIERGSNDEYSLSVELDRVGASGGSWQMRVFGRDLSHENFNSENADDRNSQEPRSIIGDLSSPSAGISGIWSLPALAKHSLTTGADAVVYSIERIEDLNWDGERFTHRSDVRGKQRLAGIFFEDLFTVTDRLGLQFAGRYDVIKTYDGQSIDSDLQTGESVREDLLEDNTETTFNPNLGIVYAASPASRIRGAVYSGFRAPMASELFVGSANTSSRIRVPNPDLEPETLLGAELGYDYTPSSRLLARLTGFWSETQDLIQILTLGQAGLDDEFIAPCGIIPPGARCQQRRNLGETRAYGAEINGEYRPFPSWQFTFETTLLQAEVTDNPDDPELVGNRVSSTPEQRYLLSASYYNSRLFDAFLRYRYVGDKFDDVENEDYMPSYQVVDFTLSRILKGNWSVFGGVENLFDESFIVTYSSSTGPLLGPPRLFHVGFRYSSR